MVYEKDVHDFLKRDDNSRCMPGKADVKKSENIKRQTRILTDYLANLYMKFIAECPIIKLSRATFCCMRPIHILTTTFISRSTCLCTKHQNMFLLFKPYGNKTKRYRQTQKHLQRKEQLKKCYETCCPIMLYFRSGRKYK